jgi:hypothetical protein
MGCSAMMRSPRRMWRVATTPQPLFGTGVTRHEASSDTGEVARDARLVVHAPTPQSTRDAVGSAAVRGAEARLSASRLSCFVVHGGGCAPEDAGWSAAAGMAAPSCVEKNHCVR